MLRRSFVALTLAIGLAAPLAAGAETLTFKPGLVAEHLAKGETVFVDFFAPWCPTCLAQDRVTTKLRAENPAYDEAITFVRVDWDTFETDPFTTGLNIPRRSTLVVLKGDKELGRSVAGTGEAEIKALLDTALGAASS
jgi:thioredoxin 1